VRAAPMYPRGCVAAFGIAPLVAAVQRTAKALDYDYEHECGRRPHVIERSNVERDLRARW